MFTARPRPLSDKLRRVLTVRLTRISNSQHRFEYLRANGSGESAILETRSLLLQDLIHFAVESEARLSESFYGLLASGVSFSELRAESSLWTRHELMATEKIVGILTGFLKQADRDPAAFVAMATEMFRSTRSDAPSWLDAVIVARIVDRLRRLQRQWSALPFGETMTLYFSPR